jgi:predicted 3-demethylubiquinone-9 3-methyltransferase (glyoxalase superfamily)
MTVSNKISSCLWFDTQAEEAANFYCSVFKDSQIIKIAHYGKAGHEIHKMPEGAVLTVEFELNGSRFLALNGGPLFKFNEAVSFVIDCDTQEEIDYYWDKLTEGGDKRAQQCGWLKDKYGLSWQVVPAKLGEFMSGKDREKTDRMMTVMLQMKKMDIKALEQAYEGNMKAIS